MAGSTPSPALLPASASQSCSKETKTGPTLWNSHQLVKLYPETPNADVDSEPFIVHRDFATCYSPVLKAAFESGFIEGQKQEYRFDEDFDEDVIRILSQWFYTQKIDLGNIREPDLDPPISTIDLRIDCLIKLWVLADRLLIPKLQNMAIESLEVISNEASVLPADLVSWSIGIRQRVLLFVYGSFTNLPSSMTWVTISSKHKGSLTVPREARSGLSPHKKTEGTDSSGGLLIGCAYLRLDLAKKRDGSESRGRFRGSVAAWGKCGSYVIKKSVLILMDPPVISH